MTSLSIARAHYFIVAPLAATGSLGMRINQFPTLAFNVVGCVVRKLHLVYCKVAPYVFFLDFCELKVIVFLTLVLLT